MQIVTVEPWKILSLIAGLCLAAAALILMLRGKKQKKERIVGISLLVLAVLVPAGTLIAHAASDAKTRWNGTLELRDGKAIGALELIDAVVDDERSELPENFRLNNAELSFGSFQLVSTDGELSRLHFALDYWDNLRFRRHFQLTNESRLFVDPPFPLNGEVAALPAAVLQELLSAIDENGGPLVFAAEAGAPVHIIYDQIIDGVSNAEGVLIAKDGAIREYDAQNDGEGTYYAFGITSGDRIKTLLIAL